MKQLCLFHISIIGRNSFAQGHSIMTKLNIKTLGELVEKDNKKTGDVKRMIDQYGVYYRNRWPE